MNLKLGWNVWGWGGMLHEEPRRLRKQSRGMGNTYLGGTAMADDTAIPPLVNLSGLCECGCGQTTRISQRTNSRDKVFAGQHLRFLPHHHTTVAATASVKVCPQCGQEFPRTSEFFHRDQGRKCGLSARCKECAKSNTSRWAAVTKPWRSLAHKQALAAWVRDNRQRYRECHRMYESNRRSRKLGNGGVHTTEDIQAQYDRQKGKCYYCGKKVGKTYHVDHVIPLIKGGSNGPENLVVACPTCNCTKGGKHPMDFCGRLL